MEKIVDFISGELINSSPEELEGTQPFSKILVEDYGYPKDHIITRPQFRTRKSPSDERGTYPVDIAVFNSANKTSSNLEMIVECKRKDEKGGIKELKKYLELSSAKIGVWFNSSNSLFIQKIITDKGVDFKELPALPKFGQDIEDIGKQTKENLVATHNLKAIFNSIRNYIAGNSAGTQRDERIASNMINLIFVKIYDERFTKSNDLLKFRASYNEEADEIAERVKEVFENVKEKYNDVLSSEDVISLDNKSIAWVVGKLQDYSLTKTSRDVIADAFEVFVGPTLKGESGQFFTPRNVVKLMVELCDIDVDSLVIDPACGTGGFLTEALKKKWDVIDNKSLELGWSESAINEEKSHTAIKTIFGIEKDDFLSKVAKVYMALLGDGRGSIHCDDSLENFSSLKTKTKTDISNNKFDVVLANPPFGKDIKVTGEDKLSQYELALKSNGRPKKEMRPDILFLERCIDLAKDGGRVGIVLIETYFHTPTSKYIRDFIKNHNIKYLCDLPHNTFRPFCNAKTIFLVMEKNVKQQDKINLIAAEQMGHDHNGKEIFRWNENEQNIDPNNIWDDISDVFNAIKSNNESKNLFQINAEEVFSKNILVPRFYWKSYEEKRRKDALKKGIKFIPVRDLIDQNIITSFDGHGSPASANKGKGDMPYIRVKDIVSWGTYKDSTAMVPSHLYEKFVKKEKILFEHDILFVRRGSYRIGSVAMVSPYEEKMILTKEIQVIRHCGKENEFGITPFFLLYAFSSELVQKQIQNKVLIETTLPNIGNRWMDLELPLYEKSIMHSISKKVEDLMVNKRWQSEKDIKDLAHEYGYITT